MISYMIVIYFTKCNEGMISVTITITQLYDTEKVIKNSGIGNII